MYTPRFDDGADLICVRDGVHTAVQVKRRSSAIKKEGVLHVVGGMQHYDCPAGILVTNSFLTPPAAERAAFYGIEVWDRARIAEYAEGGHRDSISPMARIAAGRLTPQ